MRRLTGAGLQHDARIQTVRGKGPLIDRYPIGRLNRLDRLPRLVSPCQQPTGDSAFCLL